MLEQLAQQVAAHSIATRIAALLLICFIGYWIMSIVTKFPIRNVGDDDYLTIEDFYNHPKDSDQ